jgi:hypothetical protein
MGSCLSIQETTRGWWLCCDVRLNCWVGVWHWLVPDLCTLRLEAVSEPWRWPWRFTGCLALSSSRLRSVGTATGPPLTQRPVYNTAEGHVRRVRLPADPRTLSLPEVASSCTQHPKTGTHFRDPSLVISNGSRHRPIPPPIRSCGKDNFNVTGESQGTL